MSDARERVQGAMKAWRGWFDKRRAERVGDDLADATEALLDDMKLTVDEQDICRPFRDNPRWPSEAAIVRIVDRLCQPTAIKHKPCPFCGGKPETVSVDGVWLAQCSRCFGSTNGFDSGVKAWAAWDLRQPQL